MRLICNLSKSLHYVLVFKRLGYGTQDNKYFEDSFQIYERGIALFKWPHVKDIWQAYLTQFVERYKGTKLERARDLFKQALETVCYLGMVMKPLCVIVNFDCVTHIHLFTSLSKAVNKVMQSVREKMQKALSSEMKA